MVTDMKRILIVPALVSALCLSAAAQESESPDVPGTVSYCLPMTSISFDIEAEREIFHAGPYAAYAKKYLGIDVQQKDWTAYRLTEVKMTPYIEADQSSRYLLKVGAQGVDASFLKLTSCGLVSVSDGAYGNESIWRFPVDLDGSFAGNGLISNVASESTTLYRNVKDESAYTRVAVQQEMMVAKTPEKKAAETASLIFELRRKRIQIITGDTDATYSGEAMGAAVAEITRLEKEYMTMFTGYSEYQTQKKTFEVIPQKNRENQLYVAFRVSDTSGLLPADNLSGKPVILEIVPQPVAPVPVDEKQLKKARGEVFVTYRIPAVCTVRLMDGMDEIFQSRVPVYQLGTESTFPAGIKTN